ncbi:NB-ARC domain-containing protein [Streptomyces monashensis]|uniref:NB-ARC domain-containing protein n=1 Tax=Streptomyces monashensis TaxID=1678012 RepID=UPI0033DD766A
MEAELAALAASGATTLVGLMVSESWTQAKERLVGFFARRRSQGDAEGELRAAGAALAAARAAGDAAAEEEIEAGWRQRLLEILRTDPVAAAELRSLLSDLASTASYTVISGGVHHGPAFQGAHIHGGITFTVPQPPPFDPAARPDQVPALTVPFSNRVRELAVLNEVCGAVARRQAGVGVGVLGGLPGVGKSAMARKWADESRELFPDGQLYVDFAGLRAPSAAGGETGAADVSEALAMVLRSLKVSDDSIPASLAERTTLYRSHSAGRRMLLVLDDVSHPAQVRPLIPKGPGSVVLVTSHGRLGELVLDGARLIPLEPLDAEGGLALLADRCGADAVAAETDAAGRLVELCGGLPVALQIVAARLLLDAAVTMASLVEELQDEAGRLAAMSLPGTFRDALSGEEYSVAALFGSSYRPLAPDAARLYRLLGWLPTDGFDAGVAAVAADIDTPGAKRLLDTLVAAGLVESRRDRRYRMHDLVRLHARECAGREEAPGEEKALTERVATHYLALTAFADRAVRKERLRIADLSALLETSEDPFAGDRGPDPLEWLDAERSAILAASRHRLHRLVWPLAEAFTVLFLHRRYLGAWKESLELGIEAAAAAAGAAETASEVAEATRAEARLRSLLSRPLMDLGEADRAGAELRTAIARAEATGHLALRASVQEFHGRYLDRADPAQAVAAYRRSYELNAEAGESRGAAIAAYFLGCAQDANGEHGQALATLRRARHDLLDRAEPDRRMAARALAAIGIAHDRLGQSEEAVDALREAARVLEEQRATHYAAQALVTLVDIAARTGSHRDVVREWLSRAVEIHEASGSHLAEDLRRRLEHPGL